MSSLYSAALRDEMRSEAASATDRAARFMAKIAISNMRVIDPSGAAAIVDNPAAMARLEAEFRDQLAHGG